MDTPDVGALMARSEAARQAVVDAYVYFEELLKELPTHKAEGKDLPLRDEVRRFHDTDMAALEKVYAKTHILDANMRRDVARMKDIDVRLTERLSQSLRKDLEHRRTLLLCEIESAALRVATKCTYVARSVHEACEALPRAPLLRMLREKRLRSEAARGHSLDTSDEEAGAPPSTKFRLPAVRASMAG